jgi:hypothetical protein
MSVLPAGRSPLPDSIAFPQDIMRRLVSLCALLAVAAATAALAASPQSEGFKKLTGPQIRKAFVGKTFTDETHFSFRYLPGGVIEGMSMGKKVTNKWAVVGDKLCVTDKLGEICYPVWMKGSAVRLFIGEPDLSLDGVVKN